DSKELRFHGSFMGVDDAPLLASSPSDTMMYVISKSKNGIETTPLCKIDRFQRYFAYYFEDCSSLHLDNETGQFSYYKKDAEMTIKWDFPAYTPQALPQREMILNKGVVYTLNSSKSHDVSELEGAGAYFSEVQPILSFRLDEPHGSVKVSGRFPRAYAKSEKSVPDYQPYFCINGDDKCVLSFQYCDSLYFVDNDKIRAVVCKSQFYSMPQFLSFEDSESLTATRRFEARSPMYLWITYNPVRDEYYRLFKHASENFEEAEFSVLVLDARMNQTAEFTFDSKEYGISTLLSTKEGFTMLNMKESKLKNKYCFENFGV
ncbi:MAG: hypothetical protein ABR572_12705, partial [Cryomorphaceae bacterium]